MVQEYVSQLPFSPADELMGRNRPDDAVTREEADAADELLPDPCHSTGCLNEQKPPKHPWSNRCSMSGVFGKSVDNLISLRQLARDFFTSADDLLVNMDRTPSLQKAYELQAQEEKKWREELKPVLPIGMSSKHASYLAVFFILMLVINLFLVPLPARAGHRRSAASAASASCSASSRPAPLLQIEHPVSE